MSASVGERHPFFLSVAADLLAFCFFCRTRATVYPLPTPRVIHKRPAIGIYAQKSEHAKYSDRSRERLI